MTLYKLICCSFGSLLPGIEFIFKYNYLTYPNPFQADSYLRNVSPSINYAHLILAVIWYLLLSGNDSLAIFSNFSPLDFI